MRLKVSRRWFHILKTKSVIFYRSTPQFHTDSLISTHGFHTRTTAFQYPKSLSSTPKTRQFITQIPQFHTEKPSVPPPPQFQDVLNWGVLVWNWGVYWTEGFLVWNWGILGAEKEWFFCVELMCWTEGVWNWERPIL